MMVILNGFCTNFERQKDGVCLMCGCNLCMGKCDWSLHCFVSGFTDANYILLESWPGKLCPTSDGTKSFCTEICSQTHVAPQLAIKQEILERI